jgi:hypothetical protein
MPYSSKSALTREVCDKIGADFDINFVTTMRRNGAVYVNGTIGKPQEWQWLQRQCEANGYRYTGRVIR